MQSTNPKSQEGAILLISLIILLVMTIIGIAAMSSVTLEGKMANNARNKKVSFQSAELALRAGEASLQSNTALPEPKDSGCPSDCGNIWTKNGFYNLHSSYTNDSTWSIATGPDVTIIPAADALAESDPDKPPEYAIEFVDIFVDPLTRGQQQDYSPNKSTVHYRVIARGYGGDTRARTHLMSDYARRY